MFHLLLERLPGEIITQIVEILNKSNPSSVFQLLFIRALNPAAQTAIYTHLILASTGPQDPSPTIAHLISRVLDPQSPIPSLIRSLFIPQWTSYSFPEIFRAQLPDLKSLTFTMTETANLRTITKFLDSIKGLEELTVTTTHKGFYPIVWSRVQRHGPTLRVLKTNSEDESSWGWTKGALEELVKRCEKLESLSVDLEPEEKLRLDSRGAECTDSVLPLQSFTVLPRLAHLRILKIATVLENPSRGGLGSVVGLEVAKDMFKEFFRHDPNSKMKTLELKIRKIEAAPIQEIHVYTNVVTVTKVEGKGSPLESEGAMESVVSWTEGDGSVSTYKL